MTARKRRRRAYVLLAVALACGGLAASEVDERVGAVEREIGPPVPVVVASRDIEPGTELSRADLVVHALPGRYAPPDAPTAVTQAVGLRVAGPVAAGSPITAGVVGGGEAGSGPRGLRRGERAIELTVAGGAGLGTEAAPGSRVDVLVSTEVAAGAGRTLLALEDVELLALSPATTGAGAEPVGGDLDATARSASVSVTLRVTLRQAVYLTAAQNFASELRVLPRPVGDRRHIGRATVAAEGL